VRTGVRFPSGDGRRGGTFEMWFWLVDQVAVSIDVAAPSVRTGGSVTVTVKVDGTDDIRTELRVNGVIGGNSAVGTIELSDEKTGEWLYKAPAGLPARNPVDITATSLADKTKAAGVSLQILPRIIDGPTGPTLPGPATGGGAAPSPRRQRGPKGARPKKTS